MVIRDLLIRPHASWAGRQRTRRHLIWLKHNTLWHYICYHITNTVLYYSIWRWLVATETYSHKGKCWRSNECRWSKLSHLLHKIQGGVGPLTTAVRGLLTLLPSGSCIWQSLQIHLHIIFILYINVICYK